MEHQSNSHLDLPEVTRRSALKSGAALAGAGVVTLALPSSASAASFGAAPTGQDALGGVPTAVCSNDGVNIYLDITWRTSEYQDVDYSYVWYYNDTTPRSMGGNGTASGYLRFNMGPRVGGSLSTSRWSQSNYADGKTISFYVVDPAGVRYKFEDKYSTNVLTFVSY